MGRIVTGALAVMTDANGRSRYVYQGSPVPDDIPAAEVERLAELGLIGDEEPTRPDESAPADSDPSADSDPERPAQNATKPAWVDYAVARGMDRDEAEKMTKDQLVAKFADEPDAS